jgi:hypothetical protein
MDASFILFIHFQLGRKLVHLRLNRMALWEGYGRESIRPCWGSESTIVTVSDHSTTWDGGFRTAHAYLVRLCFPVFMGNSKEQNNPIKILSEANRIPWDTLRNRQTGSWLRTCYCRTNFSDYRVCRLDSYPFSLQPSIRPSVRTTCPACTPRISNHIWRGVLRGSFNNGTISSILNLFYSSLIATVGGITWPHDDFISFSFSFSPAPLLSGDDGVRFLWRRLALYLSFGELSVFSWTGNVL